MRELLGRVLERIAAQVAGHEAKPRETNDGPLMVLQRVFDLSPFEVDVIAIGAGLATDPAFARTHAPFTLGRAFEVLEGAHLDARSPQAPLWRYRLIVADHLPASPIVLDERILLFVLGVQAVDERLRPYRIAAPSPLTSLGEPQLRAADRVGRLLADGGVIQLFGGCGRGTGHVSPATAARCASTQTWLPLRAVWPGMRVRLLDDSPLEVEGIDVDDVTCETFNVEIHSTHSYFVGESGVLVHNGPRAPGFDDTTRNHTRIYEVLERRVVAGVAVEVPIYGGKTTQTLQERYSGHIAEKKDWAELKKAGKLRIKLVVEGNWTVYESAVWEKHVVEKIRKINPQITNIANPIGESSFERYRGMHMPCP